MADVNYVSPAGMQPKVGWQPEGLLGGMLYADQQRDYKDVLSLSKLSSMYGLDKQRNELQEYGLNEAVRQAQRREAIEKANVNAEMFRPKEQAGLDQIVAQTGATNAATEGTRITNQTLGEKNRIANEEAVLKNRAAKLKELQSLAELAIASGEGMAGLAAIEQEASKLGIPPQVYRAIAANPKAYGQRLMQMDARLQAEIERARIAARGSVEAAGVRSATENTERSVYNAILAGMTEDNNKKPVEQRLSPAQLARQASEAFAARRWAPGQGLTPYQSQDQRNAANTVKLLRETANITRDAARKAALLKSAEDLERSYSAGSSPDTTTSTPRAPIKIDRNGNVIP